MILMGAAALAIAASLFAIVLFGLVLGYMRLRSTPGGVAAKSWREPAQYVVGAAISTIVLTPLTFAALYLPITSVSSDGLEQVSIIKPRFIEDMTSAAMVAVLVSCLVSASIAGMLFVSKRAQASG